VSGNQLLVIYYGWLVEDLSGRPNTACELIAAAHPAALVAPRALSQAAALNLSPAVRACLGDAGVQVFAYVPTGYGQRDLGLVKAEVAGCLADGVDGIFFDEGYDCADGAQLAYYRELYATVKAADRIVILNTGSARTGECIMDVTDIVMVEHQWRAFCLMCSWRVRYPAIRFMGCSSNEPGAYAELGYMVDGETAVDATREAWARGIGWHASTDRYTELPAWFSTYVERVGYGRRRGGA